MNHQTSIVFLEKKKKEKECRLFHADKLPRECSSIRNRRVEQAFVSALATFLKATAVLYASRLVPSTLTQSVINCLGTRVGCVLESRWGNRFTTRARDPLCFRCSLEQMKRVARGLGRSICEGSSRDLICPLKAKEKFPP